MPGLHPRSPNDSMRRCEVQITCASVYACLRVDGDAAPARARSDRWRVA
ncbi:hypothetical protein [Lysobacter gummosus]